MTLNHSKNFFLLQNSKNSPVGLLLHFFRYVTTNPKKGPTDLNQSYKVGMRTWFPCKQAPSQAPRWLKPA